MTLPPSKEIASQVLVFLLVGVETRVKMNVGFHFTGKKTDGLSMKNFLFTLINYIENRAKCLIDFIVFDLGPKNTSMLKEMGLSVSRGSTEYFVMHPNDPTRRLRIIPDAIHAEKNITGGIRRHDVEIPQDVVEKYNLSSKTAKFDDVKKLFRVQQKIIFQPAKKLRKEIIAPDHFEVMREHTATELSSKDVIAALDFIFTPESVSNCLETSTTQHGYKLNPEGFLLKILNRYHAILNESKWNPENLQDFEKDAEFLMFAADLFRRIKFGNSYLPSTTGAIIGISSIIDLSREYLAEGMKQVKPTHFHQNAIENYFCQLADQGLKPSCLAAMQNLKALSITDFDANEKKSSYQWHATETSNVCFLEILEKSLKESEHEQISEDEPTFFEVFAIPNEISPNQIFKQDLEYNSFYCWIKEEIERNLKTHGCEECKKTCLTTTRELTNANRLMKNRENVDILSQPSIMVEIFYLKLEYSFRNLKKLRDDFDQFSFKNAFIYLVSPQIELEFEHCLEFTQQLLLSFVNHRVHLELRHRNIHSRNKFSTRT